MLMLAYFATWTFVAIIRQTCQLNLSAESEIPRNPAVKSVNTELLYNAKGSSQITQKPLSSSGGGGCCTWADRSLAAGLALAGRPTRGVLSGGWWLSPWRTLFGADQHTVWCPHPDTAVLLQSIAASRPFCFRPSQLGPQN